MKTAKFMVTGILAIAMTGTAIAQFDNTETASSQVQLAGMNLNGAMKAANSSVAKVTLPSNTIIVVTPSEDITSIKMKEGTTRRFQTAEDVKQNGVLIIPRGSPVVATVTWRTGKGIVGKSAKFELSFDSVEVAGRKWKLKGKHREEGRGNTAAALLGSAIITGKSATMMPGQLVNVFTDEDITTQ